jgi:hypothetical protein
MTHHVAIFRRGAVALASLGLAGALMLALPNTASAAVLANVPMGTAAHYSVLAGTTVTNTGASVLHESLGVSPGTSITGFNSTFPSNGSVVPPAVIDNNNGASALGEFHLGAAYTNATRTATATKPADLTGLTLGGGVYNASAYGPLSVTGTLTLDGANNPNTVFIFTTDSLLTIGAGSHINVIRGAQECNIYWRVGSSATLHAGAEFRGNILAQTAITLDANVTVHGRALAQTAAVTLISDTFLAPTCATVLATTTTAAPATTAPGSSTTSPGSTVPAPGAGATTTTVAGGGTTPTTGPGTGNGATTTTLGLTVGIVGPPKTGVAPLKRNAFPWPALFFAGVGGSALAGVIVRRRMRTDGTSR